jgi:hypothetical protein
VAGGVCIRCRKNWSNASSEKTEEFFFSVEDSSLMLFSIGVGYACYSLTRFCILISLPRMDWRSLGISRSDEVFCEKRVELICVAKFLPSIIDTGSRFWVSDSITWTVERA